MTGLEKRLARSNARYAADPIVDLVKVVQRGRCVVPLSDVVSLRDDHPLARTGIVPGGHHEPSPPVSPSRAETPSRWAVRGADDVRHGGPQHRDRGERGDDAHEPRDAAQTALSVWVRLLKAHSLILREVRRDFGEAGEVPTLPQFDVLAQLSREPEGLTLVDLSRRLLVSAGNLTGIVTRLERDGLVRREEDPRDGRAFRIRLTPRGRTRAQMLIPKHARLLERVLAGFPVRELEDLRELLGRLGDRLVVRTRPRTAAAAARRRPAARPGPVSVARRRPLPRRIP